MRVTIIPSDSVVSINGVAKQVDLSFMLPEIHAVQWYDDHGDIEYKNPFTGQMTENEAFADISRFQQAIDAWNAVPEPDPLVTSEQM